MHYNKLLHGADYNPDQWLDCPDVLEQDIELMKSAHINCVALGIFSWIKLEPEEGRYELDWMEDIINNLHRNGISTILATPSGAKPNWMSHKYPQIRRVNNAGQRMLTGGRHNHCYTSPVYREKIAAINERLSERFGKHPGVILWHISNEYGGECHCEYCTEAFREWLKDKYNTLENLNHEWWTTFWSHEYSSWEEIQPPNVIGEQNIHGLTLDWRRFITYQTIDFMKHEIAAVRERSDLPVTTNFMEFFNGLNYFKVAKEIDVVSWDSYPRWHCEDDVDTAVKTSLMHDLMRSLKRKPFLLMESTPSMTNWQPTSKLKRPGMHMLSSIQAIAHGSDSVQYFQWRKSRGGWEKFHGAAVDHVGHGNTRVYKEVAEVGAKLQEISSVCGTETLCDVAIIFDWENRWAVEGARGPRNIGMNYVGTITDHYRALWEMGVNVELVDCEGDISGYKLVIAPMLYMYRAGIGDKLRDYVKNGGTLVGTYWSGIVNENDLCFLGGFGGQGMDEVFGLWAEEIDSLKDGECNTMTYYSREYKLYELCELVHSKGAEVLAKYTSEFYAGMPSLLCNSFAKGKAYYLAARAEREFYKDFYSRILEELSIFHNTNLPYGTTQIKRGEFNFKMNFKPPYDVNIEKECHYG